MDLCAWHPGILVVPGPGVSFDQASGAGGGYTFTARQIPDIAAELRAEVGRALVSAFGAASVDDGGTKAFTLSGMPGSRAKSDVVPAVRADCVVRRWGWGLGGATPRLEVEQGVAIYPTAGPYIVNFPEQHYSNGIAKRQATSLRFKKVVRILKRLRDELVTLGKLQPGQTPSFLIECLVYRVEDEHFLRDEDLYGRVRRVVHRIGQLAFDASFASTALEINDVKLLFGPGQAWTIANAQTFFVAAFQRLEA